MNIEELCTEAVRRLGIQTCEWHSWPEVFGSTAGPTGGIGGRMLTTFQVIAFREIGSKGPGIKHCAGVWREWSGEHGEPWGGRAPLDPIATRKGKGVAVGHCSAPGKKGFQGTVKVGGRTVWACGHDHPRHTLPADSVLAMDKPTARRLVARQCAKRMLYLAELPLTKSAAVLSTTDEPHLYGDVVVLRELLQKHGATVLP